MTKDEKMPEGLTPITYPGVRLHAYSMDSEGNVWSHLSGGFKNRRIGFNNKYVALNLKAQLKSDGEINMNEHRLIAHTLIPNPLNKPEVNHKDGDKTNNAIDNLEWSSRREQIDHAASLGLVSGRKRFTGQPVEQFLDGKVVKIYSSATEAASVTGFSVSNIGKACRDVTNKPYKGFTWSYLACEDIVLDILDELSTAVHNMSHLRHSIELIQARHLEDIFVLQ